MSHLNTAVKPNWKKKKKVLCCLIPIVFVPLLVAQNEIQTQNEQEESLGT